MILVTGMHRSGTSLVAMTMEALGVDFGDHDAFYEADQWNERGYFERRDVMDLNSRMITGLDRTGSKLSALAGQARYMLEPPLERVLARGTAMESEIAAIQSEIGSGALKDPRFCLTWKSWSAVAEVRATVVCIRHPYDVADSLRRRQRIPIRLGVRFWRYHMAALRAASPPNMIIVDMEELISDPGPELERLLVGLDINLDVSVALSRFSDLYSPGLAKVASPQERPLLEPRTRELWDWLAERRSIPASRNEE